MDNRDNSTQRSEASGLSRRLLAAIVIAGVLLAAAVVYGSMRYVGHHWQPRQMGFEIDTKAGRKVEEFFAGDGARWVAGLKAQDVTMIEESRGRSLKVTFVSDGSDQANNSLTALYYGATTSDGWTAALNAIGLKLVWVNMEFRYPPAWVDRLEVDVVQGFVFGTFRLRGGASSTAVPSAGH
jgi:hypothetical protein